MSAFHSSAFLTAIVPQMGVDFGRVRLPSRVHGVLKIRRRYLVMSQYIDIVSISKGRYISAVYSRELRVGGTDAQ